MQTPKNTLKKITPETLFVASAPLVMVLAVSKALGQLELMESAMDPMTVWALRALRRGPIRCEVEPQRSVGGFPR